MTCADDWWDAQQPDPEPEPPPEPDKPYRPTTNLPDIAHYQPLQETT